MKNAKCRWQFWLWFISLTFCSFSFANENINETSNEQANIEFASLEEFKDLLGKNEIDENDVQLIKMKWEGGFLKGTQVETEKGSRSIEEIQPGDLVLSCDDEQVCTKKEVQHTFHYKKPSIIKIIYTDNAGLENELKVSPDHRFYSVQKQDWVRAEDLSQDDELVDKDHHLYRVARTKLLAQTHVVYNFTVDGFPRYFAGPHTLLVHNSNPLQWSIEALSSIGGYLSQFVSSEAAFHQTLTGATFLAAAGTFASLMIVKAPYGRHNREGFGPQIPNKVGWVLMEIPSVVGFASIYMMGANAGAIAPQVLAGMWLTHYIYRTFVFPNMIKTNGKTMPLSIALGGFFYNCINSYLNARWISHLGTYAASWLVNPKFIGGALLWAFGFILNVHSDWTLINLRKPGETGYKIPKGGGFDYVSSPNYLGEMIEWLGWSVATWSMAGFEFFTYTVANLLPRAFANHEWYQEKFEDGYPEERKAIIPFLW